MALQRSRIPVIPPAFTVPRSSPPATMPARSNTVDHQPLRKTLQPKFTLQSAPTLRLPVPKPVVPTPVAGAAQFRAQPLPSLGRRSNTHVNELQVANVSTSIVQLKIHFNKITGFFSDGSRPGWRKFLKDYVVDEYSKATGKKYTTKGLDLNKLKLDRCHRVSFSDIQGWVVNWLKGTLTDAKFTERTDTLYKNHWNDEAMMTKARSAMFAAKTNHDKLRHARNLLSLLNSATGNVNLGNASINRSIQEMLDPNFVQNSDGTVSASPKSKNMMNTLSPGATSGLALTPNETNVRSSHVGGAVSLVSMTPGTRKAVSKQLFK